MDQRWEKYFIAQQTFQKAIIEMDKNLCEVDREERIFMEDSPLEIDDEDAKRVVKSTLDNYEKRRQTYKSLRTELKQKATIISGNILYLIQMQLQVQT